MSKQLYLLDGHALVYRAHYAFIARPLMNSKKQNVSAISGFMNTVWEIMQRNNPSHLAVAFDPPGDTFRNTIFPAYKANREAQPEDITFALPYLIRILEAMRVPIVMAEGFEADDVIGTLAYKAHEQGFEVFMVTPDKDYGQLVRDGIYMVKPGKSGNDTETWGPNEVCQHWGIDQPEQVIDLLALQGDSADNIPGVPGIGPKTAAALLQKFKTLEGVLSNAHALKGKQQENLIQYADQARLSYTLATINTQVPIDFDDQACFWHTDFDTGQLAEIFKELEMRSLADKLIRAANGTPEPPAKQTAAPDIAPKPLGQTGQMSLFGEMPAAIPQAPTSVIAGKNIYNTPHTYHLCSDENSIRALCQQLLQASAFSFDTETTSLDATQAELVGLSFSIRPGEAWYVPIPEDAQAAQAVLDLLRPALTAPGIEKIGQNIKYDFIVLQRYGVRVAGPFFDTMLAHYIYEPEMRHNMDYLAEVYLGYKPISIESLIGKKGKNQGSMRHVPVEQIAEYAAEDADITLQLKLDFENKLQTAHLLPLLRDIEIPLMVVLADMELAGINIDVDYLNAYADELHTHILKAEAAVYDAAGFTFNIGSPKQVGEALFDRLKLPYKGRKTSKSDQYSTDEDQLSALAPDYPVAGLILRWRGLTKLLSTYVEALPKMVNPLTGRIHSSFNQALAATGRLSSNNPNLQNIPIRTPEGRRVRQAFIPRDNNHRLLAADYSQIELRLIAEICGEEAMLKAFEQGHDIHASTAALVYQTPLESVTPDQRRNAKTVNFSILYGAGALNVSQQLGISRQEAKTLIDNYFSAYPGLKKWMEQTVADAREKGYVTTLMGRRRYLRDINSRNGMARSNAERIAINSPVQGSAADMIKKAMIDIHKDLTEGGFQTQLVLQVHDELVFDVPLEELDAVKELVVKRMQHALPNLRVPIDIGVGIGQNWLEAH